MGLKSKKRLEQMIWLKSKSLSVKAVQGKKRQVLRNNDSATMTDGVLAQLAADQPINMDCKTRLSFNHLVYVLKQMQSTMS